LTLTVALSHFPCPYEYSKRSTLNTTNLLSFWLSPYSLIAIMQDSDAAERLRDLLARSGTKAPVQPTLQHTKTITPVPSPPVTAQACKIPPKSLDLDYPRVKVPGSPQSSTLTATPPSSPKSIFGSGLFGYSKSSSRTTLPRSLSNSQSGGFFNSLFRRSTADRRKDEAQDYQSVAANSTELSSSGSSYCVVGSSMNMLPGLTSIFHSGSPSKIAGGNALLRARSEDSISAKRNDFEHRRYKASKISKTAPSSPKALSPRPTSRRIRTISWADQIPKQSAKSPPPSSDLDVGEAQTKHGSEIAPLFAQEDFDSSPSSSTLSLNSPFSSSPHLPAQPPTHQPDTADTMPTSLRDLSPFKGQPLWEPDDEEWAELDATQIFSTFKATFKEPSQNSPQKSTNISTLSRFSATLTSFIPSSPTKRAFDAILREEEALRDRLEELQNTYYSNPAGDICDKVMTSVFLPGSQYFHHDQSRDSVRAPHVIDLEAYFNTQDTLVQAAYPRLSDAIATILSHTNRQCVEAFLDLRVEEFVYRREVERNKAGSIFVIRRKGNAIIVSPPCTTDITQLQCKDFEYDKNKDKANRNNRQAPTAT